MNQIIMIIKKESVNHSLSFFMLYVYSNLHLPEEMQPDFEANLAKQAIRCWWNLLTVSVQLITIYFRNHGIVCIGTYVPNPSLFNYLKVLVCILKIFDNTKAYNMWRRNLLSECWLLSKEVVLYFSPSADLEHQYRSVPKYH